MTSPPLNGAMSLSGKTIVFTGTLSLFKRAEAKQMAESVGAKVTAAVRCAL